MISEVTLTQVNHQSEGDLQRTKKGLWNLNEEIMLNSVKKTGKIVTAEEHNILGGLGESVARVLAQKLPTKQAFVAVNDTFGESGTPSDLMKKYGIDSTAVIEKVKSLL